MNDTQDNSSPDAPEASEMPMLAGSAAARLANSVLGRLASPFAHQTATAIHPATLWRQIGKRLGGLPEEHAQGSWARSQRLSDAHSEDVDAVGRPMPFVQRMPEFVWRNHLQLTDRVAQSVRERAESRLTTATVPMTRHLAATPPDRVALPGDSADVGPAAQQHDQVTGEPTQPPNEQFYTQDHVLERPAPDTPETAQPVVQTEQQWTGHDPLSPPVHIPATVIEVQYQPSPAIRAHAPLVQREPLIQLPSAMLDPSQARKETSSRERALEIAQPITSLADDLNRDLVPTDDLLARMVRKPAEIPFVTGSAPNPPAESPVSEPAVYETQIAASAPIIAMPLAPPPRVANVSPVATDSPDTPAPTLLHRVLGTLPRPLRQLFSQRDREQERPSTAESGEVTTAATTPSVQRTPDAESSPAAPRSGVDTDRAQPTSAPPLVEPDVQAEDARSLGKEQVPTHAERSTMAPPSIQRVLQGESFAEADANSVPNFETAGGLVSSTPTISAIEAERVLRHGTTEKARPVSRPRLETTRNQAISPPIDTAPDALGIIANGDQANDAQVSPQAQVEPVVATATSPGPRVVAETSDEPRHEVRGALGMLFDRLLGRAERSDEVRKRAALDMPLVREGRADDRANLPKPTAPSDGAGNEARPRVQRSAAMPTAPVQAAPQPAPIASDAADSAAPGPIASKSASLDPVVQAPVTLQATALTTALDSKSSIEVPDAGDKSSQATQGQAIDASDVPIEIEGERPLSITAPIERSIPSVVLSESVEAPSAVEMPHFQRMQADASTSNSRASDLEGTARQVEETHNAAPTANASKSPEIVSTPLAENDPEADAVEQPWETFSQVAAERMHAHAPLAVPDSLAGTSNEQFLARVLTAPLGGQREWGPASNASEQAVAVPVTGAAPRAAPLISMTSAAAGSPGAERRAASSTFVDAPTDLAPRSLPTTPDGTTTFASSSPGLTTLREAFSPAEVIQNSTSSSVELSHAFVRTPNTPDALKGPRTGVRPTLAAERAGDAHNATLSGTGAVTTTSSSFVQRVAAEQSRTSPGRGRDSDAGVRVETDERVSASPNLSPQITLPASDMSPAFDTHSMPIYDSGSYNALQAGDEPQTNSWVEALQTFYTNDVQESMPLAIPYTGFATPPAEGATAHSWPARRAADTFGNVQPSSYEPSRLTSLGGRRVSANSASSTPAPTTSWNAPPTQISGAPSYDGYADAEADEWAGVIADAVSDSPHASPALALAGEERSDSDAGSSSSTDTEQSEDGESGGGGGDVDDLAESVYAIIRRRLSVERERHFA